MNIKIELFKSCIFMLIGAFICARFMPQSKPDIQIVEKILEKKSGIVTRKIVKKQDGSEQIDEVENYLSSRESDVSIIQKQPDKKNEIALIPKYSFKDNAASIAAVYSYENVGLYLSSDKQIGLVLSLKW